MIKRYHEAPLAVFDKVQQVTDGDYALVHLFESNPAYYEAFANAIKKGRDVLLDNSLFELRTAFDPERFAHWINELKPTWYIVPDCWKNGRETTRMFFDFVERYPSLPGKRIGVAQGHSVEEVAECYLAIEPFCDMVAFNLDFSSVFYDAFPSTKIREVVPYCVAMSYGRAMVLRELCRLGVINEEKPHHLLGCGVPQEASWYPRDWTWVRSIDTCNPVMHGLRRGLYPAGGLQYKLGDKMCDAVNEPVSPEQTEHILKNIVQMQQWCE